MTGTGNEENICIGMSDQVIQVGINEVDARRSPPLTE